VRHQRREALVLESPARLERRLLAHHALAVDLVRLAVPVDDRPVTAAERDPLAALVGDRHVVLEVVAAADGIARLGDESRAHLHPDAVGDGIGAERRGVGGGDGHRTEV
jgi:hypothetical protein